MRIACQEDSPLIFHRMDGSALVSKPTLQPMKYQWRQTSAGKVPDVLAIFKAALVKTLFKSRLENKKGSGRRAQHCMVYGEIGHGCQC